ncbi:MAG TPA: hypothetical protein P5061_11795, partial [Mycobacterium sp.]|nr:hypothetical protein [Mycobacterium sp.]
MAGHQAQLTAWQGALASGDPARIATTARQLTEAKSRVDTDFRFTVCDHLWRPTGVIGPDLIEGSGTDPRNNTPTARITVKGNSTLIDQFMECRKTLVGIEVETAGLKWNFYTKIHRYKYERGAWTGTLELKGIWDILNYLVIWPTWFLPIQTQPVSHATYLWALCTVLESMVAECAMRIQSGILEFVNNSLSLNADYRAWFATITSSLARDGLSIETFQRMLKTPIYVKRTNPFLDTSPLAARTVRMETCGQVITDITRAYGVDTRMDLWRPGDPQPDQWAGLDQPTYVFSAYDRSQIEGPTKTVADAAIRTVIDIGGSLGGIFGALSKEIDGFDGQYQAPSLGVNFVPPWAVLIAPEPGEDSSILSCEISDHTPDGWQHIIGGRSPKWLNDLMNASYAWLIDSVQIVLGFTGIPSDLLSGFLNNAFLAFQLVQHYDRRSDAGPYHPAIERFHATASSPYNVETTFAFINALFDSRGYTAATVTFRNGHQYALGRDLLRGGLMTLVYRNRRRAVTDYVEN